MPSMILFLSHPNDCLAVEVQRRARAAALPVRSIDESTLFTAVPFALRRSGRAQEGFVQLESGETPLSHLSGVFVRLPRVWWPSSEFDLQDQTFVYHETTAAWYCLLTTLACPVINRFSLGWWLHDMTYPEMLRNQLARRIGLETVAAAPGASPPGRLYPLPASRSADAITVYAVGERLIPGSSRSSAVMPELARNADALRQWQREMGISLCRLDFESRDTLRVKHVEVFPLLEGEAAELVDQITAATLELLS
jgi:hypothetical protein